MAFIPLTPAEIAAGEPVTNGTQTRIKDNFDALNSRVTAVEGGASVVYTPIILRVNGFYQNQVSTRVIKTTINFNITITGIRLIIDNAGSSGTTEIDLLYRRGGGYTSVLSTKPSVAYSAGSDAVSNNAVLDLGQTSLQTGDIIALDITSVQSDGRGFMVRIDYNKT